MKATELLRRDHHYIEHLLEMYRSAPRRPAAAKMSLFELIDRALSLHESVEDQRFFPMAERVAVHGPVLAEVRADHSAIRALLLELRRTPGGAPFDRLMRELDRSVRRHHRHEDGLFNAVDEAMPPDGLEQLGAALGAQKSCLALRMHCAASGAPG